jgi:catechol 2,3-dioxygenase-like lactoylglutathione lyase family enzyme
MGIVSGKHLMFLGVDDIQKAQEFYEKTLGLRFVGNEMGTLIFDMSGTPLRISQLADFRPQTFTVLGWITEDINAATEALIAASVQPTRYPGIPQDEHGIATLGTIKIVWFNDPAGNVLSFTQA